MCLILVRKRFAARGHGLVLRRHTVRWKSCGRTSYSLGWPRGDNDHPMYAECASPSSHVVCYA